MKIPNSLHACLLSTALLLATVPAVTAAPFTYQPAGVLTGGSGTGLKTTTVYSPDMRFPIQNAPAYLNSQVWGIGGMYGPKGSECNGQNYSYPWWDNYCEKRSWSMPLCPSGKGHQGQDMRPGTCQDAVHWTAATEAGKITSIGTYSLYLKGNSGRTYRYLHMKPSSIVVKVGQTVQKGQQLGKISDAFGTSSTSIHLHFDIEMAVKGVGVVFVSPYLSLVNSYKDLIGPVAPTCDAAACAKKSSCQAWSACGGLSGVCDQSGSQTRTCTAFSCQAGACKSTAKNETQACAVKTDGKVVKPWTAWGACGGFVGPCDEKGSQSRTSEVCKDGKSAVQTEQQACQQSTAGKVLKPWSAWGSCGGFTGVCGQSGSQTRSAEVCKDGKAAQQTEQQACSQVTDGKVVTAWSAWSECGGFLGLCHEKGSQTRSAEVCQGGAVKAVTEQQPCAQSTAGKVVEPWSMWSPCVASGGPCDAKGKQTRKQTLCKAGSPVTEVQSQACEAATDCPPDAASEPDLVDAGAQAPDADAAPPADEVDGLPEQAPEDVGESAETASMTDVLPGGTPAATDAEGDGDAETDAETGGATLDAKADAKPPVVDVLFDSPQGRAGESVSPPSSGCGASSAGPGSVGWAFAAGLVGMVLTRRRRCPAQG